MSWDLIISGSSPPKSLNLFHVHLNNLLIQHSKVVCIISNNMVNHLAYADSLMICVCVSIF